MKSNQENMKNSKDNKSNNLNINENLLIKEEKKLNDKKSEFEKNLFEEIKIFDSNYEGKFLYFINKFDETIKILTKKELNSLNGYINYFN